MRANTALPVANRRRFALSAATGFGGMFEAEVTGGYYPLLVKGTGTV
ncbi:MAG: hypothetical protein ABJH45_05125 [Paracoccaceae bacterium]